MRDARAGPILLRVSDQVLHIAIEMKRADEEIHGQVSDGIRQPTPFSGWLGLIGALDEIMASPPQASTTPSVRTTAPASSAEQERER